MELRSRSRSKTPFLQGEVIEGSNHVTVTRSSTRTTSVKSRGVSSATENFLASELTANKANKLRSLRALGLGSSSKSTKTEFSKYITSDYSSAEDEELQTRHISQNEKNQIIEDARRAANGTAEISALGLYRKAGRYWDKYPKTDWTYSPHSRDRVELAPGVVAMPNMSRRTIHSSYDTTDSYYEGQQEDEYRLAARIKQRLFNSRSASSASSNNNYSTSVSDESYRISRAGSSSRSLTTIVTSFFIYIYTSVIWSSYAVYRVQNSVVVWIGKQLHHFASRVMLMDTWLLRKQGARTAASGDNKIRAVILLCLLPLLLFGAWWLLSAAGSSIYAYLTPSAATTVLPIFSRGEEKVHPQQEPLMSTYAPPIPPSDLSVEQLELLASLKNVDTDEIVAKVLNDPQIRNVINNYHTNIKIENQQASERIFHDESLINLVNDLKAELNRVKAEFADKSKTEDLERMISVLRVENARSITRLTTELHKCCHKPVINLEPHVGVILERLLNDPAFLSKQEGLVNHLKLLFVAKNELEERLSNLTDHLGVAYTAAIDATAKKVMDQVARPGDRGIVPDGDVKLMIKRALEIYDADKTGLVDYAMEPMGGQVLTTRCTESYRPGTTVISVLGIPIWYPTISPRTVITPGVQPGECWAFQNFPGLLVIKLASPIKIDAFSMEHISRLLVPNGKIDSASKDFEVYGLTGENDRDPQLIGKYVYDYDGDSLQYFAAVHNHDTVFEMIEIRIHSNHGNPNYTCLYRFRVHGTPQ